MLSVLAVSRLRLDPILVPLSALVFALGSILVLCFASRFLASDRFGRANAVTLVRWMLTAFLLSIVGAADSQALPWLCVGVAGAALALDGIDGWLARRYKEMSSFGARFDMEIDALLILALTALVWRFDRAGAWVMVGGLLRYGFVAFGYAFAWLQRPLPASKRRQTVCVIQIVSLLLSLAPITPAMLAPWIAGLGLLALSASFAIDAFWLARNSESELAQLIEE